MAEQSSKNPFKELGVAGDYVKTGYQYDEFLTDLRGLKGIKKYREMRDNDPTIGAVVAAIQMMLRSVDWVVDKEGKEGDKRHELIESVMDDMDYPWANCISNAVEIVPYGFSFLEVILKRREDGDIGIKELAPRAQWTLYEFIPDKNGKPEYFHQQTAEGHDVKIPLSKGLLFTTPSANNSPLGRSVLRNAYTSYHYLSNIKNIEAIAIERELNGLPVGYIPSEYLTSDDPDKIAVLASYKKMLRDVKLNEQGYMLLPSDPYIDDEGKYTSIKQVDFKLVASEGTRAIDTNATILRYQQDITRSVLADFLMLGTGSSGSRSLGENKTDLFYKSLDAFLQMICSVINQKLIPMLMKVNGLSTDGMPKLTYSDPAPVDLQALGDYVRSLGGAGIFLDDKETQDKLRFAAKLPETPEDQDLMGRNTLPNNNSLERPVPSPSTEDSNQ